MELLGNEFLTIIKDQTVAEASQVIAKFAELDFTAMFTTLTQSLTEYPVNHIEVTVAELINAEPVKFSVESGAINLPLRYTNAITKLIDEDTAYELNIYMIIEHPLVSQSGLFIQKAASVAAYEDDTESVQARIEEFFNEKLALIQAGGWSTLVSEKTTEEELVTPEPNE